jgi:hypothetical protein
MPARPPALPVHLLGHDRPGEPALAHVRLRLRPERPCPERQARPVRCSARTPAPAPMATFPNATCTTNASAIANKGKGRNGACGARRDIYGESVIINLWLQPPLFFFRDELTAEMFRASPRYLCRLPLFIGIGGLSVPRSAIAAIRALARGLHSAGAWRWRWCAAASTARGTTRRSLLFCCPHSFLFSLLTRNTIQHCRPRHYSHHWTRTFEMQTRRWQRRRL